MRVYMRNSADRGAGEYDVVDRVSCELGSVEVDVREEDGALIVMIKNGRFNRVEMESRAAAIWINVRPE